MAMPAASRTLLLTGASGVGKSTLLRRLAGALGGRRIAGFTSEEIRVGGRRQGFRVETLDGDGAVLAHTDIRSPHRVGKYGVDVEAFERLADPVLRPSDGVDVYLIDEIGPMECLSPRFVSAVRDLLASDATIVATIHRSRSGFVGWVKGRPEVELWEVTRENRERLLAAVVDWLDGE